MVLVRWERKGKVYIPHRPQRSHKSQIAVGEKKKRYIYPQPPMDIAPKRLGETRSVALRSGEMRPPPKGRARRSLRPKGRAR